MTQSKTTSTGTLMLNNVRIAFPDLFTAKAVTGSDGKPGKPRFGATLLLPPDHPDLARIKAVMIAVANEKWGSQGPDVLKGLVAGGRVCLRSGDSKPEYDGFPGNLFVSANATVRPMVLNRDRSPVTEEDGVIYPGCRVNASLDIWAQANQYGKRVNAQLRGIQFVAADEPFGGGQPADVDEFADLSGVDAGDEFAGQNQTGAGDDAFGDLLGGQ